MMNYNKIDFLHLKIHEYKVLAITLLLTSLFMLNFIDQMVISSWISASWIWLFQKLPKHFNMFTTKITIASYYMSNLVTIIII